MNDTSTDSAPIDEHARHEFERAWHSGRPRPIEEFLPVKSDAGYLPLLLELIAIEMEFAWKAHSTPTQSGISTPGKSGQAETFPASTEFVSHVPAPTRVEDYLTRFDQLRSARERLELVQIEYEIRQRYGDQPSTAEYVDRFGHWFQQPVAEWLPTVAYVASAHRDVPSTPFQGTERFSVVRELGRGGMGVVYEVVDQERQTHVALKTLSGVDPSLLSHLKREFRSLAELVHPNLVPLYELISEGELWFFTMELIEGVDFRAFVQKTVAQRDFDRLRDGLRQLSHAVTAIHSAGKLHRDIKPSNVLVRTDGRVVLVDFGLVTELHHQTIRNSKRDSNDDASQATFAALGTFPYMSPEQAAGHELSAASDWYAVGVILFEALTGGRPFAGTATEVLRQKQQAVAPRASDQAPQVPEDLDLLCAELLSREPAMRPQATEILARLAPTSSAVSGQSQQLDSSPEHRGLVGRSSQLAQLNDCFQQCLAGNCVVAHLYGPAGVGKSMLAMEYLNRLSRESDCLVLSGKCYEQESVPYKAVDSLIEALTARLLQLPEQDIAELLSPDVAVLARVFPALGQVPAIAAQTTRWRNLADQREQRLRAFTGLQHLLHRLSQRQPVVLWIDDLHWGDTDSAALLKHIAQATDRSRLLLIATYRSEYIDTSECLRELRRTASSAGHGLVTVDVAVGTLTPSDARELVRSLLGDNMSAESAIERITLESEGNPYFIAELVRYLKSGEAAMQLFGAAQPVDLKGVLWQRICSLPEEARSLLQAIAVAGRPISTRIAQDASRLTTSPQILTLLRGQHFIRSTGLKLESEVTVYHERIRESILRELTPDSLRDQHELLATCFESSSRDIEAIAFHYAGAGQTAKAGELYLQAAGQAAESLAFDRAAHLYRRSLELIPANGHARRVALGEALVNAGHSAEAGEVFEMASEETDGDERIDLQRLAGLHYCVSGRIDLGRAMFELALRSVGAKLPGRGFSRIVSLLGERARLRLRGLRFHLSREEDVSPAALREIDVLYSATPGLVVVEPVGVAALQTRGLRRSLDAGEPMRLARSLLTEAVFVGYGGTKTVDRAAQILDKARSVGETADDPMIDGLLRLVDGHLAFQSAQFDAALEHCAQAESIFRDQCTGASWETSTARAFQVWICGFSGKFVQLADCNNRYLQEARSRSDLFTVTNLTSFARPLLRLAADDPDGAMNQVEEALSNWPYPGFHIQHYHAACSRTLIHLYRGEGEAAWNFIQQTWPALRRSMLLRIQFIRIWMHNLRGQCALARAAEARNPEPWLRRAEKDLKRLSGERSLFADALALRLLSGINSARGQQEFAGNWLRTAIGEFDQLGMVSPAAALRQRLADLTDGDEQTRLIAESEQAFSEQGIINLEKMTQLYAFPRTDRLESDQ